MKQHATAKVSGECSSNGTEIDLAGEVKDRKIMFSFTSGGYTLNYTGKVEGDSMTGDIEVAGTAGTFSGKRDAN